MSAITAKASRKMKKYAVLTREPRCFLGSFDFSWEQRKFEEIAVRSSVICSDDTLPRVEYEDIVSGAGRLNKDIYAKQSSKSGIAFHQGDVLYGKLRPYLQNWLLPTFDGLAVGDFWVLQPQNADSSFLYRLIQSRQFDEVANQSTGTKMPRADWKLVSKTVFSIPSNISEQAAIGTYFTALDSLITLHQRKCVFLFSFFQAFISMIFTASTFSWEQRKVQDVADRFDNLRIPVAANLRVHGTTPYYGANGIQDYVEGFTHDGEFVLVAEDGANDLKNYPVKCVNGRIWVNNHAHILQGKAGIADNSFLAFAISQSDIESLLVGGGRAKLNAETLMSIEFRLPCLQEQYRIGEYLTQLDHLITLHQRECISFTARAGRLILTANKKRNTSSWEQRKLGDVVQITMGQSPDGSTYSDEPSDYILVQGNADLQNGWVCPRIWTTQITKKADAGDLIMSVRAPAGAMGKTAYNAVIGRGVAAIKGNEFIYQLLVKMDMDGFWKTLSCGSTFESLNSDNIKNAEVKVPTTAEQVQIGDFFRHLDNLITLHQRKPFLMKWRTSDANRNQTNRLVL